MSEIQANKLSPSSGTALQIGDSGDAITIPSGATITNSGTQTGFGGDNDPMFSAKHSGSNQGISTATWTKVTCLSTELYDYDSTYDGNRFTVPSGITNQPFFISGIIKLDAVDDQKKVELSIRVNGTEVINTRTWGSADTKHMTASITYSQQLSSTDYVELWVYHNTGSTESVVEGYFSIHKLIKG